MDKIHKLSKQASRSFTLIELLIVIVIIAIIAGAILVAINPAKRLAQANDSRRYSEVRSVLTAVNIYIVDSKGQVPVCGRGGSTPFTLPPDGVYRWMGNGAVGSFKGGTWLLDQDDFPAAGQTPDDSENNNYGTINEAIFVPGGGKDGITNAFEFDGSDDKIEVTDSDSLDIENDITLSAWVKLDSYKNTAKIIIKTVPDDDNPWELYALDLGDDGKFPRFIITTGIFDQWYATHDKTYLLSTDEWYLITGVYDGEIMKLYVNGTLITDPQTDMWRYVSGGQTQVQQVNISIGTNDEPLLIGGYNFGAGSGKSFVDGIIDEVAVFDYVMSDADVAAFYNGGAHIINGAHTCDLANDLVAAGNYLSSIPQDPTDGNLNNSGYLIKRDSTGTISVKAPHASDYATQEIMVSR